MKNVLTVAAIALSTFSLQAQSADSAVFYFDKGKAEQQARRYREAEKNLLKASSFDKSRADITLALAEAYLAQNKYFEARNTFLEAEKLAPENGEVLHNLATLSLNMRKWDDATRYAQKMRQLKINKPVSYIIGKSFYEQQNYGEAIKHLNQAIQEEPLRADNPYMIARAYLDMSNYRQSAAFFEKAIALDTTKLQWIYEAALVHYAIPDYKKSLQYFELASNRGIPRTNDFLENLGNAYINVNQFDKGIQLYKEVLQRKPSDQELLYNIAQAYYKSGKYSEAIEYWDQVLGNDKSNARALYMIGLSYQKKGEKQKGSQLCDRAIELDPSLQSLKQKQGDMAL